MATTMKLRLGVADDPTQMQPSLSDCMAAMLKPVSYTHLTLPTKA